MKIIKESTQEEHDKSIQIMSEFFENDLPQVGIFWVHPNTLQLFGIQKGDASLYDNGSAQYTYPKLHKTYWQKQHYRAAAKQDTNSIFYQEHNYTKIPRGRIFVINDKFVVKIGHWFNELSNQQQENLSEIIQDEFNLPDNFEFQIDSHWDLGKGWSEEKF